MITEVTKQMKVNRLKITLDKKSYHTIPLSTRGSCNSYSKIRHHYMNPIWSKVSIEKNMSLMKGAYIPSMSSDISIGEKIYVSSYKRVKAPNREMITWNVESI